MVEVVVGVGDVKPPIHQCDQFNPSDDMSACAICDYYESLCKDCLGRRKVGPSEAEVTCPHCRGTGREP